MGQSRTRLQDRGYKWADTPLGVLSRVQYVRCVALLREWPGGVIQRVTASGHWSQSAAALRQVQLATFKCLIQGTSFRTTAMTDTTTSTLETINNNASEETWRMRNRGQQTYKMIPNIVNTATVDDWRVMMVDQLSLISWFGHPARFYSVHICQKNV